MTQRTRRRTALLALCGKATAIALALFLIGSAVAFAGGKAEAAKVDDPAVADGNESPMLARLVAAGELPPLEERLPTNPLVVQPFDEVGRFGGEMRLFKTSNDDFTLTRQLGYEPLIAWPTQTGYGVPEPNLARAWEVSPDDTEFTFYLREGIRWSDGEPFTADDIMYWYEDMILNTDLNPTIPAVWRHGGEPVVVTKIDDYTVRFKFAEAFGTFLFHLASPGGLDVIRPAHYLKQFHADYADPDELAQRVRDAGYDAWFELHDFAAIYYDDINRPVLHPWILTTPRGRDQQIARRNPYYWKVDTAGNQLPYVDTLRIAIAPDTEVAIIQALAGEFDLLPRYVNTVTNRPLFAENMQQGNYHFAELRNDSSNVSVWHFNQTHEDPVKRAIFREPDFRKALSHAIDREEIIELIYFGLGEPAQGSPLPASAFYHERHARGYLEYDPDLANRLLDGIGLSQRDSNGWRLRPDGRRLEVLIESSADSMPHYADLTELMSQYWRDVGVFATPRMRTIAAHIELVNANQHDTGAWHGIGGGLVIGRLAHYFPGTGGWSAMGPPWGVWYNTGGEGGEEPPDHIKQLFEWQDALQAASDPAVQAEIMKNVFDQHYEMLYTIGISRWPPGYAIVHNRMRNVPDWWWDTATPPHPAMFMPQVWIAD